MKTFFIIIAALLASCVTINRYYVMMPKEKELIYEYPSIDPGFFSPINEWRAEPGVIFEGMGSLDFDTMSVDYDLFTPDTQWIIQFDTSRISEEWILLGDTITRD